MSRTDDEAQLWADGAGSVVLGSRALWLPSGRRGLVHVDLLDLRKVGLTTDHATLVVSTGPRTYRVEAEAVGGKGRLYHLFHAVFERITAHPQSERILRTLAETDQLESALLARRPRATQAFIAICLAAFGLQMMWGATLPVVSLLGSPTDDPGGLSFLPARLARLVAMGANTPGLVDAGEYFRLATANFLHAGWGHLLVNLLGLMALGPLVERLWGSARFVILFLLTGLTGAVASTWLTAPMISVGVSTALLGLLGAYFVIWLRFRTDLPPRFSVPTDRWVALVVINGVIWWYVPAVDHFGHLGGALGGVAVALAIHPLWRRDPGFVRPTTAATKAMAIVLSAVFVAAAGWAATVAARRPLDEGLRRLTLSQARQPPTRANLIAWAIATWPEAEPPLLRAAEATIRAAVDGIDSDAGRAAILDTWATLSYRLGRHREAVSASLSSIQLDPSPVTMSQAARFLKAYLQDAAPYRYGVVDGQGVSLELDDGQVKLTRSHGLEDLLIVGLVERGGRLEGSLWIQYSSRAGEAFSWPLVHRRDADREGGGLDVLGAPDATLRLALIATSRISDYGADVGLKYLPMDPGVRRLP